MSLCGICGQPTPCPSAQDARHVTPAGGTVAPCRRDGGAIWVEVQDGRGGPVAGVQVQAAGRTVLTDRSGHAEIAGVPVGAHTVSLAGALPAPHDVRCRVPPDARALASVAAGEIASVQLALEPVNVLTPRIVPEYRVVLLDRGLARHPAGEPETDRLWTDATYIDVALSQSDAASAPFAGTGTVRCAPSHVEVFLDEQCTSKLTQPLTADQLTVATPQRLWLRGRTAGMFTLSLTLDGVSGPAMRLDPAAAGEPMAVVALAMSVHVPDVAGAAALRVNPDTEPVDTFYQELESLALPPPIALSDADKIARGALLHVQQGGSHARVKLRLEQLDGAWPAEADAYEVSLRDASRSGAVAACDAAWDGSASALPAGPFTLAELRASAKEVWIEGTAAGARRGVTLSLTLDRAAGGPAHAPKANADAVRMTVVQIADVRLDIAPEAGQADPWEPATQRFFVNLKRSPTARDIDIGAQLSEGLADVTVHFMLVDHRDNRTAANWGVDLPAGPARGRVSGARWVWKDITPDVKHRDKTDRRSYLHVSAKTDARGYAKATVRLSQLGGDRFYLAAYLAEDYHLARYIDGHPALGTRKPPMRAEAILVWRKFWYKEIQVEGLHVAGFGNAADAYADVKAVMEAATPVVMSRSDALAVQPPVIYPKHMVSYYQDLTTGRYSNNYPNDMSDALVLGDTNRSDFMVLATPEPDKPVMLAVVNAHALWADSGIAPGVGRTWTDASQFPIDLDVEDEAIDPPIQGGTLLAAGMWEAEDRDVATGQWIDYRSGHLAPTDIWLDPGRDDPRSVRVGVPNGVVVAAAGTRIQIIDLAVRSGITFLGTAYVDGIVNSYTPNDLQDFVNTIVHEVGHKFGQVPRSTPPGVPLHSLQYSKSGSHCKYQNASCIMYASGSQPGSLNKFCPVCHPYVLIQDMSRFV
jgi:hypothetical protein